MCSPKVMEIVRRQLASERRVSRRGFASGAAVAAAGMALAGRPAMAQEATPADGGATSVIDLSHVMSPETPVWPGNESFSSEVVRNYDEHGFFGQSLTFWEHTGTHLDAPAHFFEGEATADELDAGNFIAPLVVVDISERAAEDADAALSVEDLQAWESEHGEIPAGAFVAMNSGWADKIDDAEAFVNLDADGVQHYPGFHPDAAEFLVSERSIVGVGTDTLSLDPGNSTDFGTHIAILGGGMYGVEGLASLGMVAPAGATVFIGGPKHIGGSGGPARVLALMPAG